MPPRPTGVSVAICCHNSTGRLPPTLRHLRDQRVPPGLPWEVLVVDNASTDDTAGRARSEWPESNPAPLRIVHESRAGLQHARAKAFAEAAYSTVGLIDDDNWVAEDWVARVHRLMEDHPDVGAAGGTSEAASDVPLPEWFSKVCHCYAVGTQGLAADAPAGEVRLLWGAGMALRLSALDGLWNQGFRPRLLDRQGKSLSSSGDTELCLALRLAGWKLWYDPALRFRHYLPEGRLTAAYARRLYRGIGGSLCDPYYFALGEGLGASPASKHRWRWVFLRELWYTLRNPRGPWRHLTAGDDALDDALIEFEIRRGRLASLWAQRRTYDQATREIATASWRSAAGNGCRPTDSTASDPIT